jgi:hypothetical protein
VLDQASGADSGLRPNLSVQSGDVEGSIRHLVHEDLEAYASGQLPAARLDHCQAHLDSCEACRAELEDLRTLKSELSSFTRTEPNRHEQGRRKRRRKLTLPLVASVATTLAVVVAAALWWEHQSPWPKKTSAAVSVARLSAPPTATHAPTATPTPSAPLTVSTPARDTRLADEIAALPDDMRSAVSATIQHGKLPPPTDASRSRSGASAFPGAPEPDTGFALLRPFGEAISETRPEFSWQPLAGAIRYSVVIVDAGLHPVQRSPRLRKTVWRPGRPLRRGRTYLWQVTATLRGHSKVVASAPSPSGAVLRIIPLKLADEMARFRQTHQEAHLVLGALYAQAGMLAESAAELSKVPPGDSSYDTARALLESLSSKSPHDTPYRSQ